MIRYVQILKNYQDCADIVDAVLDLWCTKDVTNGSSVQSELFFVSKGSVFTCEKRHG